MAYIHLKPECLYISVYMLYILIVIFCIILHYIPTNLVRKNINTERNCYDMEAFTYVLLCNSNEKYNEKENHCHLMKVKLRNDAQSLLILCENLTIF